MVVRLPQFAQKTWTDKSDPTGSSIRNKQEKRLSSSRPFQGPSLIPASHEDEVDQPLASEGKISEKHIQSHGFSLADIRIFRDLNQSRGRSTPGSMSSVDLPHIWPIQAKLAVNQPGDQYEQEADRIAEQVMRMPGRQIQRVGSCSGKCPKCQKKQAGREPESFKTKRVQASATGQIAAPPLVHRVLAASGQVLDPSARAFLEPRFGRSFTDIRIHTDAASGESARAMGALAYASGNHIVFAPGQYAPGSDHGRQLLAHELAHVQQRDMHDTELTPLVQRQDDPTAPGSSADDRANDPNFLMCLALCELGISPNLWRTVVNDMLGSVSQEYRDKLGDMRGSQEFESWRAQFIVMSSFNKLKLAVGFLGESRVGLIPIRCPLARAIRLKLLLRLSEGGLKMASLKLASQIIRKIALAIEVSIATGCTAYCGATAMTNALLDFSSAALGAVASFVNVSASVGAAIGQAITMPILVAQISMDPANWNLSALPARSRANMQAIGLAFRLAFTPDSFLASMAKPLSSYNISQILAELADDINATLQTRGGFAKLVTFTSDFIGGLTPLQFVDILKDYRLLTFVQDPEALARQQQVATPP